MMEWILSIARKQLSQGSVMAEVGQNKAGNPAAEAAAAAIDHGHNLSCVVSDLLLSSVSKEGEQSTGTHESSLQHTEMDKDK